MSRPHTANGAGSSSNEPSPPEMVTLQPVPGLPSIREIISEEGPVEAVSEVRIQAITLWYNAAVNFVRFIFFFFYRRAYVEICHQNSSVMEINAHKFNVAIQSTSFFTLWVQLL